MTALTIERRAFDHKVEYRAADEGKAGPGQLEGYAASFDSLSRDLGGWFEEIDPRAFGEPGEGGEADMLLHSRVLCRSEHDSRLLLGTTDAGTLRLFVDEVGLRYEVDLPDTTAGRDAAVLAARGDYRFSSFAFHTLPEGTTWREDAEGRLVRRVTAATLVDVAPVADPAYFGSSVAKRSFDLEEIRAGLRSADTNTSPVTPPGEWERDATKRALAIADRGRTSRLGTTSRSRGERSRHLGNHR